MLKPEPTAPTSAVLMTFLGRAPKNEGRYRTTRYDFDGRELPPVAFVGWQLGRELKVERMLVLGTAGSMWDHLFETDIDLGALYEAERVALMEAVARKSVTAELLAPLIDSISQARGCHVELLLIPDATDFAGQIALVKQLADHVHERERVHLDVTHGMRHLPMVALMAMLHLRLVKQIELGSVLYSEYNPDTDRGSIHDLGGLLHIADWFAALTTFRKDGDYGVLAPLLERDGLPLSAGRALRSAAFFERVLDSGQARGQLRRLREPLSLMQSGLSQLFRDTLMDELAWVNAQNHHERQFLQARHCVDAGDYLRAVVFAFEATISKCALALCGSPDNVNDREFAREHLKNLRPAPPFWRALRQLRNALAHGERKAQTFTGDADARTRLASLIDAASAYEFRPR